MSICSLYVTFLSFLVWGKVNKNTANHKTNGLNIEKLAWQFTLRHSTSCKAQHDDGLAKNGKVF